MKIAPMIAIPELDQNIPNYIQAVRSLGGVPVIVSETGAACRADDCDALLLPGGGDINPSRYGQKTAGSRGVNDALDTLQLSVLDAFVRAKKPVFGICRGHQLINVYFGGTLVQDLPTALRHAKPAPGEQIPDRVHEAYANHGSYLARIYGVRFRCNSSHHQGVDRLGEGLEIDSRCSEDGVVEAMHHMRLPIWSVQWHPERMGFAKPNPQTVSGEKVFGFFLAQIT